MRGPLKKAALVLLPVLVHAIVIPEQILEPQYDAASNLVFEEPLHYGGPPTFFAYGDDDDSIKFSIPCPDCSDEEKELLKKEVISIKPTLQSTENCAASDPIGLEIDGQQVVSTGASDLSVQTYVGPLYSAVQLSKHHIFNRTRWINTCGCPEGHLDGQDCTGHYESSFSFQVLGLASGQVPGFTLSFKQAGAPELLRLTTFPDIGIADARTFGQSAHYLSPRLRPQRAALVSSVLISSPASSTSLPSPSSTDSASSPSHTYSQRYSTISEILATPTLIADVVADHTNQASLTDAKTSADRVGEDCDRKPLSRCLLSNILAGLGHRLGAAGTKARSGSQAVFRKIQSISTQRGSQSASYVARPSKEEPSHDELDGPVQYHAHNEFDESDLRVAAWQAQQEAFLMVDSPQTFWDFDKIAAVKAFQVTSLVFIIVAFCCSILVLLRRNPRLRAHWATLREERRNRHLYRIAARKHRFQTFFDRFRISSMVGEKAAVIPTHHDTAVDSYRGRMALNEHSRYDMQNESGDEVRKGLQAFRKVHRFVDSILSAEEGRSSSSRHIQRNHFTNRTVRHQRTWSFGSEKTAPPAYDSEGEDVVVDASGNRFMVIDREVIKCNRTPGSSIISTSPRTSCADSDSEPDEKF